MKAMILAAGKGTRLFPITGDIPKPMIPLLGERLLDRVIGKLKDNGFDNIAINTAHLGDKLMSTYGNGKHLGVDLLYSFEGGLAGGELMPYPLGSAGGMREVQTRYNFFDEDFAVVCGDAYFDFDLKAAMAEHRRRGALATVLVKPMPEETLSNYGVVKYDDNLNVESFQEKPAAGTALSDKINTGIYIFNREIFDYIPESGEYDIGSQLLPDLVERGLPFIAFETKGSWLDVGKIGDLHATTRSILCEETDIRPTPDRYRFHIWIANNAVADPSRFITRGELFIDSGAIIDGKVIFEGTCSIGRNCVVEEGARLCNTQVIGDHLRIPGAAVLEDKIVTNEFVINNDGSYAPLSAFGICDAREISGAEKVRKVASR